MFPVFLLFSTLCILYVLCTGQTMALSVLAKWEVRVNNIYLNMQDASRCNQEITITNRPLAILPHLYNFWEGKKKKKLKQEGIGGIGLHSLQMHKSWFISLWGNLSYSQKIYDSKWARQIMIVTAEYSQKYGKVSFLINSAVFYSKFVKRLL